MSDKEIFAIVREEFFKVLDAHKCERPLHSNDTTLSTDQWVESWEAIARRLNLDPVANPEGIPNLLWYSSLAWYARKLLNQRTYNDVSPCGRFVGGVKIEKGGGNG